MRASSAIRFPSRDAAKSTPPAVARTPLVSEPRNSLNSHFVLPSSGSIALMPALRGGPFGPCAGGRPVSGRRPMYCRPRSIAAGALAYCCPPSAYSRYSHPLIGLYYGAWKLVAPPRVGYTTKLPSLLEFDPGTAIGRPLSSKPLFQF